MADNWDKAISGLLGMGWSAADCHRGYDTQQDTVQQSTLAKYCAGLHIQSAPPIPLKTYWFDEGQPLNVKKRSVLEKLRAEISDWHGNVLDR